MNPLVSAVAALLTLAATAPVATAPVAAPQPRIVVPAGPLAVGGQITVTLHDWPAGTMQLEICGNNARRGALDCANEQAIHVQVRAAAPAVTPLLLAAPPVACPCLLRGRTATGAVPATVDLPLIGVTAPPAPAPAGAPELVIDDLRIAERNPLRAWFGFPEEVTVHLALRNPGPASVDEPTFTLLFGRAGRAHTIVPAPTLGTIGAGETRDYRIQVPTDLAVIGKHELHGRIDVPDRPVAFVVETTRYPWGLLILAAILIVAALRRSTPTRSRKSAPLSATTQRAEPSAEHYQAQRLPRRREVQLSAAPQRLGHALQGHAGE